MVITVRVATSAKTEAILEIAPGVFRVRVREKPIAGKATSAVFRVLAEHFRVPQSHITLLRGMTSREKVFEIVGL